MRNGKYLIQYLVPRLQDLLFIAFFYLVIILGTNLFRDGDPGRHITFGKYMIEHLTIPTKDFFSYTMYGQFVPPYDWISQLIIGCCYMLMGLNGVVVMAALAISIAVLLVYKEMLRRGIPKLLAFVLATWTAICTMPHWVARPHIFSFIILTIFISRLVRLNDGEKISLWHFPLLMLLWVNLHATYFTGMITWFAFLAGAVWDAWEKERKLVSIKVKKFITIGIGLFLVTFINPSGYHVWTSIVGYAANKYLVDLTGETRSVDFHQINGLAFLITLTGALLLLSISKQKRPMAENLLIAGWAAMGLYGYRNAVLFAIVAMPLLSEHLKPFFLMTKPLIKIDATIEVIEKQLKGFVWPATIVITVIILLLSGMKLDGVKEGYHFNNKEFPVEAVNWLESHPQSGNMYNYFPWGGYLIYRIWPEYKVFIDGQLLYPVSLIRQHEQVLKGEAGWEETLAQYKVDWILVPVNEPIVQLLLLKNANWQMIYEDQTAVIFRKR